MKILRVALFVLVSFGLVPCLVQAQDVASVTGVVTDTSGAVVVGADVTLVNTTTNATYHATTNSLGTYNFVQIPPSVGYKITFSQSGFQPLVVNNISLTVGNTRTQNAKLHAGDVATSIEVSAANSEVTLNTTDATIGNNFDVKLLNDLPVQVRDSPSALFTLQAGVAASGSVTGARTDQTFVTVDGLDVNDISTGQAFLIVANAPVDSVQEFRGTVAGQLADSGPGSGGQFQLVTKSGTNQWHGSLSEYHRDTSTVANTWFNDNAHVHLPHYVRNQFGGNASGPIKKDKAFFFFNFYDSRLATSSSVLTTVPLDSYRNGTVQYILANATNGSGPCAATSRASTTPYCVGSLTPAQVAALDPKHIGFSSSLQTFLNARYPHANDLTAGDGLNTGGYRFNAPSPSNETNYVGRLDYTLTSSMKLFAKYGTNRRDSVQTVQLLPSDPVLGNPFSDRSYNYVIGHTWTIGTTKVNQLFFGDVVEKYNFPATYAPTGTTVLTFGGGSSAFLGSPYNEQQTQKRRIPIPEVHDDFSWQKGSHSLSFGGSFKFIKTESQQILDFNFVSLGLGGELLNLDSTVRPVDIRTTGTTGTTTYDNAFAFGLGRIASVDTNYNYTSAGTALPNGTGHVRRYRYYQTDLYAGDTWKVSKNLTLTYGLRYQLYSVPYEVNGGESIQNFGFDKYFAARLAQSAAGTSGDSVVPFITYNLGGKANNAAPLYQPNYKDFAPRASFAYNPTSFPKLVINGGAGLVYDRTVTNALNFIQDQSSFLFQNSVSTPFGSASATASLLADPRIGANFAFTNPNVAPTITKPYTPNVSGGSPFGLGANTFNSIIDPNLKDPYSIAFNAGIQQQMPGNFVLKVSYVERLGRRLLAQADASQLIDFPDKASGQLMSTAFANMTLQKRAGVVTPTPQPWFENQVAPGWTKILYNSSLGSLISLGDFADFIQFLGGGGYIDTNVGMPGQFSENTYYTNKGFSNYSGLLVTLDKNMSHGLQFDFNYTWSHSIDNTSLIANSIASGSGVGFICDATRPRECRANSDFDVTTVVNGNFTYQLPIGHGRTFATTAPRFIDELIGGWDISGIPTWRSGVAFGTVSNAFVAGYAENAPAIFNGNRAAVQAHVHKQTDGTVNMFSTAATAQASFVGPIGLQVGSRNNLRGPSAFAMDTGVAKKFRLSSDRFNLTFRADAFNVLNHPTFSLPTNDISSGSFGRISSNTSSPRVLQLALRLDF